jgi:putative SOS response-associated peptidase YedK
MCGRADQSLSPEELAECFALDVPEWVRRWPRRYNVTPGTDALVIVAEDGHRQLEAIPWGLTPGKSRHLLVNLKAETAANRKSFDQGRAIMPVAGFYEWRRGDRQPFYVRQRDGGPLALAALIERNRFAVLTTQPDETVARLHDRAPLVVPFGDLEKWLSGSEESAAQLLSAKKAPALTAWPVGTAVNSSLVDGSQLIKAVDH